MKTLNQSISEGMGATGIQEGLFDIDFKKIASSLYKIFKKNPDGFFDTFSSMLGELNDMIGDDEVIPHAVWVAQTQGSISDNTFPASHEYKIKRLMLKNQIAHD